MNLIKYIPKIVVATGILSVAYAFMSVGKGKNALNNYGKYLPEDGSGTNQIDALQIANTIHDVMRKTNFSNKIFSLSILNPILILPSVAYLIKNKNNVSKEEIILAAFSGISVNQFAQVIKAFGLRYYNPNLGNDYTILGIKPRKYSLPFWLKSELNDNEYSTLKTRFSKYLK